MVGLVTTVLWAAAFAGMAAHMIDFGRRNTGAFERGIAVLGVLCAVVLACVWLPLFTPRQAAAQSQPPPPASTHSEQ